MSMRTIVYRFLGLVLTAIGPGWMAADAAPTVTPVHAFEFSPPDGPPYAPWGPLMRAADGYYYGTLQYGGQYGAGGVYRMDGAGNVVILHEFNGTDGAGPLGALVQLPGGDLLGTTYYGGDHGVGTVIRMDLSGNVTVLHSFGNGGSDGAYPPAGLVLAGNGAYYGTTQLGGTSDLGTVFKVDSLGTVTPVHSFDGSLGYQPFAPLLRAGDGNLYGTTQYDCGAIFKVDASDQVHLLHAFNCDDGAVPRAALVEGNDGYFYGTTYNATNSVGTFFRVDAAGNLTTLLEFLDQSTGYYPSAPPVRTADGNFFVTALEGGAFGTGTLLKLSPLGEMLWRHDFQFSEGFAPRDGILAASTCRYFGTATDGGDGDSRGTIYRIDTVAPTSLAIDPSVASTSSVVGQAYTVAVTIADGCTPTGTIAVSDGSTSCSIVLPGTSCALTSISAGTKTVTASYGGDADNDPSGTSSTHTVLKASPLLSITSDQPDPSVVGAPYTVSVALSGAYQPTGSVTVADGAGASCTITLPATSCALTATISGGKVLTASYAGDGNNRPASASATHNVSKANTNVRIASDSPDPSTVGQPFTVVVEITGGYGTLTGSVSVTRGVDSCSFTLPVTSCSMSASSSKGTNTLKATYSGDVNNKGGVDTTSHSVLKP
jgi:uncharacterized repeat protein (TIGR03803 family)